MDTSSSSSSSVYSIRPAANVILLLRVVSVPYIRTTLLVAVSVAIAVDVVVIVVD